MADLKTIKLPPDYIDRAMTAYVVSNRKQIFQNDLAKEVFDFFADHYEEYQKKNSAGMPHKNEQGKS